MTTQAIIESNRIKSNLLSKTQSVINTFVNKDHKLYLQLELIIRIYSVSIASLSSVKKLRTLPDSCTAECEAMCLSAVAEDAISVRDQLEEVRDILIKDDTRLTRFLAKVLWKPLIEWDDLVEDCTLSADKEFRGLISQLSKAI